MRWMRCIDWLDVQKGADVKNAALEAAGLGAVDDWNTEDPNNPDWELCKATATASTVTYCTNLLH